MKHWWIQKTKKESEFNPQQRAVAYYRHSAQDKQENSILIQQEQVQAWAIRNGLEIIKEFSDSGKSGLNAEGRPAFMYLMENWVKKHKDFKYLLCLDVSRWGRFPDIDLSATYSAECKRHGKEVIYTDIGKPREDDPMYPLYLQFERYRAAQYSRELSSKVWRGCMKIAEQGYWAGGKPPYGFQRMLLNEVRQRVQTLNPGERKGIQNQRVILVPGNNSEVDVICRIFSEFVKHGFDVQEIADNLNREHIISPGGLSWDSGKVHTILKNELYAGTMVYNKTSQKLKTPIKQNPRENWVRTPKAFDAIIDTQIFEQAQNIIIGRNQKCVPEIMLEKLRDIVSTHGALRPALLRYDALCPCPATYAKYFGTLDFAYQKACINSLLGIHDEVLRKLSGMAKLIERHDNFIVIDQRFTVLIQPSMPLRHGYSQYWFFRPDLRPVVDMTIGVPVSQEPPHAILGYLLFPRLLMKDCGIRLFGSSEFYLEAFGRQDLDFMQQLIQ